MRYRVCLSATLAVLASSCGMTPSPPPTLSEERAEIEEIFRREIERPPEDCLVPPRDLAQVTGETFFPDQILIAGVDVIEEYGVVRRRLLACQNWWSRIEAD